MNSNEEPISDYDYYSPLLSLPKFFNTEVETIPWNGSYIKADEEKSNKWKQYFKDQKKLKVGIVCW